MFCFAGAANAAAPRGVVYFEAVSRSREAEAAITVRYCMRQERWDSDVSLFESWEEKWE
jgi:hypothetical protein